jgi:bifunctional non-homologous end joining protein LigD
MEVRRAAVELPATFYAFDLLAFEDFDLRPLPLARRKELLSDVVPKLGALRYLDHIETEGEAFLKQVTAMGLEGIVAKKSTSRYRGGRSGDWLKIKAEPTGDFVIVGFTKPKGNRAHLGALQLADWVNGTLVYAGRVGTGFNDELLKELHKRLDPIVRKDPLCAGPVHSPGDEPLKSEQIPETSTTTWVEAVHVCEVRYRERTPDGLLRHAAFVRLRNDKSAHECERQDWEEGGERREAGGGKREAGGGSGEAGSELRESSAAGSASAEQTSHDPPPAPAKGPVQKNIVFTNLKKIYWPAEKYTKGDLIDYYRAVSKWLLPYLANRPVVLTRFPDGIDGKSFYQKYLANMGSIPLHIWASRVGSLELPDWCVIDLDPKEAPFSDVIRTAQVLHRVCETAGLPNFVKTTGKTGLHIMVPLGRQCTYEQSRMVGELLARCVLRELNDIATITRHVTKRGDKVYLDYLQNRHGQTIVAPFSVRPLPGATVSMPLLWDEVNDSLDPKTFTIKNAVERLERLGSDPVLPVLEMKPDLALALEQLASVMA